MDIGFSIVILRRMGRDKGEASFLLGKGQGKGNGKAKQRTQVLGHCD